MQPDTPFAPQEEKPPVLTSQDDAVLAEIPPVPDALQPAAEPRAETAVSAVPPAVEKKRSGPRLAGIAVGTGLFLIFGAIAWVGYWAYQLNSELTTTQQELLTLQAEHQKLETDYAALTGEKEKLNADLTKAQSDLAASQAEVKKLQDENQKLNARVKKAGTLAEILNGFFHLEEFSSFVELDAQIKASNDPQLKGLWDEFAVSPSEDSFGEFLIYLIPAIQDALK